MQGGIFLFIVFVPSSPRVSIVLPVWQAGETIRRAVESVISQTFNDWELIVVDDGSSDHTVSELKKIAAREPRLILEACRHQGVVAAANRAVALARGDYIARLDADDAMRP